MADDGEEWDLVGTVTFEAGGDEGPRLIFRGPEIPGLAGVGSTMILSYDARRRRVRVQAGLATEEEEMVVDLANLPEDWRRLFQHSPSRRTARLRLSVPPCSSLRSGNGFMSFEMYKMNVSLGRPPSRPTDRRTNLLNITFSDFMHVYYQPLTKKVFNALVGECRSRQIGLPIIRQGRRT